MILSICRILAFYQQRIPKNAMFSPPRNINEGEVSTPGFNVGGEREFRDHGYVVEFLDEIDDYSNATFLMVSPLAGTELFDAAIQLANQLDGDADNAWISDSGSELGPIVH
jgi:hypothetical protein